MALFLKCPFCGEEHRLQMKYAAVEIVCPSCLRSFIPVARTGVPCPRCDSMVLIAHGCTDRRPVCLECGYRFHAPRRDRELLVFSLVTLLAFLVFGLVISALCG